MHAIKTNEKAVMRFKNIETIENEKKRIKWGGGSKKICFPKSIYSIVYCNSFNYFNLY